jgi:hypothetical protein
MKTARFSDLVKKAGPPDSYLLWSSPKTDRVFQRAVKENRILTIHQENVGTKKDYGRVGFHEEPNAQFLMFPKSLKSFGDRRVIGINYDLLSKDSRAAKPNEIPRGAGKGSTKKAARKTAEAKSTPPPPSKRPDPEEPEEKIVAFEKPAEKLAPAALAPATKSRPKKSTGDGKPDEGGSDSRVDPHFLTMVKRAMKDLDAGKAVAAYKRLESLLEEAGKRG